jgi:hypothetical protein
MSGIELHNMLASVRLLAVERLLELMTRVKVADLTPQEVLALVAVLESADQRVNALHTGRFRPSEFCPVARQELA